MHVMEHNAVNALGKELKRLRKEKNFRQEEVAERLHIKRQTYSHYETGRAQPSIRSLCMLSSLYAVPMHELLKYMDIEQLDVEWNTLSAQEDELLNYYRKLDEKEREEILVFMKIRGGVVDCNKQNLL